MEKRKKKIAVMAAVVILIAAGTIFALSKTALFDTSTLSAHFYDKNGNPIPGTTFAVVTGGSNRYEGVSSMDFTVNMKNTGELPLTFTVESASPSALSLAMPTNSLTANPGETVSWKTSRVSVDPFIGTSQNFAISIKGTYTYAGQAKTLTKQASLSYSFAADPLAGFTVDFQSSVGAGGAGTNGTLKTSGTACSVNSECTSNSCAIQNFDARGSFNPPNPILTYCCDPVANCNSCSFDDASQTSYPGGSVSGTCGSSQLGKMYSWYVGPNAHCTTLNKACA